MQEKSKTNQSFSERTDALARELRVNVSDLPEKIEVSASMFHSYRSGKYPISAKAWRKLEAAERDLLDKKGSTSHVDFDPFHSKEGSTSHVDFAPDAESCGKPKENEKGGEEILQVLLRIAASLDEIARKLPEP